MNPKQISDGQETDREAGDAAYDLYEKWTNGQRKSAQGRDVAGKHGKDDVCTPAPADPAVETTGDSEPNTEKTIALSNELDRLSEKHLGPGRAKYDGKQMLRAFIAKHGTRARGLREAEEAVMRIARDHRAADRHTAESIAESGAQAIAALAERGTP